MWNLYSNGKFLEPLVFSRGNSQEDVVKEVLKLIESGKKIIFIHGVCGTGKSAIALNIAKNIGKASVVVPIKNLQEQYRKDYGGDGAKYLLKEDGSKLKISVITGRGNHKCKFLEDNKNATPVVKKETDSTLHNIFEDRKKVVDNIVANDISADNPNIPCKIEIREGNWNTLKKYLRENKNVSAHDFTEISDVKRVPVASVCPYWCPVLPERYELGKGFENVKKKTYTGLGDTKFVIYCRQKGCSFYEQFNSFIDSDIVVFNSMKYKLESALHRKPSTEVEIIDECDEFLDSFSNQRTLNVDRLQNALIRIVGLDKDAEEAVDELHDYLKQIKRDERIRNAVERNDILPLNATSIFDILRVLLKSAGALVDLDESNYLNEVIETARIFDGYFKDTYVTFERKEGNLVANIVTTNLAKKFNEMVDKNKAIVLMSGTLHSSEVLNTIFGLNTFELIEAETQEQGQIVVKRTGLENDCKYSNFSNGCFSREDYLKSLNESVKLSKKPTLVHVNAFVDLPTRDEIKEFSLGELMSREGLKEIQKEDKSGYLIKEFKKGETEVLFSTRASRGMDFPGSQCHSIIFTKYPNPNVQDPFWKILMKTQPQHYWSFYRDKARRELLQKIYRGLRSKDDKIELWSPDSRVLDFFEKEKKL
jgi:Helicase C-terminal domain/Type III restriction enzyme, res subunit